VARVVGTELGCWNTRLSEGGISAMGYKRFYALTSMVEITTMAPPPDFTDFNHLLHDETAILNCNVSASIAHLWVILRVWILSVSYFVASQDMPPSAAPTSPNIRFQLPYALPSEPQMGMSSIHYVYGAPQTTQGPYFALENALNSFSTALPQTVTTYHDDSVRNCVLRSH